MRSYADTGLLVSLYLPETTSATARGAVASLREPLPLIPSGFLELRNAFNFAIQRKRLTEAERDKLWRKVEQQIADGFFVPTPLDSATLHAKARELSDRHTPTLATRSLDLLHLAAALLLNAQEILSLDDRVRRAAAAEGLKVKP